MRAVLATKPGTTKRPFMPTNMPFNLTPIIAPPTAARETASFASIAISFPCRCRRSYDWGQVEWRIHRHQGLLDSDRGKRGSFPCRCRRSYDWGQVEWHVRRHEGPFRSAWLCRENGPHLSLLMAFVQIYRVRLVVVSCSFFPGTIFH